MSLFAGTHDALVFAFRAAEKNRQRGVIDKLMNPAVGGSGRGLGGLAGVGQAGLIRAEIKSLGSVSEAILTAAYAPEFEATCCASCGQERPNRERGLAVEWLAHHVDMTALVKMGVDMRLRRALVRRFFSKPADRPSMSAIAEGGGVDRGTATKYFGLVTAQLKRDHSVAFHKIDARLKEIELVGTSE